MLNPALHHNKDLIGIILKAEQKNRRDQLFNSKLTFKKIQSGRKHTSQLEGPPLLTWFNFNPNMDKQSHTP